MKTRNKVLAAAAAALLATQAFAWPVQGPFLPRPFPVPVPFPRPLPFPVPFPVPGPVMGGMCATQSGVYPMNVVMPIGSQCSGTNPWGFFELGVVR